ncbi:MAG TPA: DUF4118 domain-containing protein, partial [Planctomycetota bacterium]|nr:DUF4118 domain-containing protein [Planctomycetota bacterium]
MLRHVRDHGIAYLVAVLATAAVAALRSAIGSDVGDAVTNIPFVVPVLLAARYGGFVPGVFATVLCATASVFLFVPPHFTF